MGIWGCHRYCNIEKECKNNNYYETKKNEKRKYHITCYNCKFNRKCRDKYHVLVCDKFKFNDICESI